MKEIDRVEFDQLLQAAPGGIAKLAFDDMLTILYATETFFSLIKNVSDKSVVKFPMPLLRMVYSADIIYITQQVASQKTRKDNKININFRTLQQDGSFRWVMITGNKTEETFQSATKTVPVYSCIAMDITTFMVKFKKLEQLNDYNRAITELSKDLFFEYEIATDTLSFSEIFREIFGKESVITGFRSKLEHAKTIHPDELPAIIKIYNSIMSGRKQARFEVRLIPKGGTPNWYICYASIIFDENRNPYKVVGKLALTNHTAKESVKSEKTSYLPELDTLTNVCNKDSAEYMIADVASSQTTDSLNALLLIEVKNFKAVNEIRKSIGGQNVLTEVAELLKKHVRTTDIIGRIGQGEFVIYLKDIASDGSVYRKAEALCKGVEEAYSNNYSKNNVSISIGSVIHRGAQKYHTLVTNATAALVIAKKVPTCSFEVFGGSLN
jgi:diguanylate cyclase (GGDEF) domain